MLGRKPCRILPHAWKTSRERTPVVLMGLYYRLPADAFAILSACMSHLPILPRVKRRRSKLHGWGVFALEPINKNTRIIDYAGELIDHKESLKRETTYLERGEIWVFTVNRRWVRDAHVGGNDARFINHACKPNCYSQI